MMRVLSWNAQSLMRVEKRELLFEYCERNKVDIIGVSEIWDLPVKTPGKFGFFDEKVSGWRAIGFRHSNCRRGVAVFAPTTFPVQVLRDLSIQTEDCIVVSIRVETHILIFPYIPNGNYRFGLDELHDICNRARLESPQVVVMGDLNARIPDGNACGRALHRDFLIEDYWERVPINVPTNHLSNYTIDHVLISPNVE